MLSTFTLLDPKVPLCGACIEGLSETYGATTCEVCDRNYFERLMIPLLVSAGIALWLVYFAGGNVVNQTTIDKSVDIDKATARKLVFADNVAMLVFMFIKPIAYFLQGLFFIVQQGGVVVYLTPILQLFNFDTLTLNTNNNANGVCLLKNMTPIQKIAMNLIIPTFLMFFILFYRIILRSTCICCNRQPKFLSAFWVALLLIIGSILSTFTKLLACRSIGNETRRWYAGNYIYIENIFAIL